MLRAATAPGIGPRPIPASFKNPSWKWSTPDEGSGEEGWDPLFLEGRAAPAYQSASELSPAKPAATPWRPDEASGSATAMPVRLVLQVAR
jgi:hypothetical protein